MYPFKLVSAKRDGLDEGDLLHTRQKTAENNHFKYSHALLGS